MYDIERMKMLAIQNSKYNIGVIDIAMQYFDYLRFRV